MANLNHMICPLCGHDFYCEAAYGKCDACQCVFYASQSKTCKGWQQSIFNKTYPIKIVYGETP